MKRIILALSLLLFWGRNTAWAGTCETSLMPAFTSQQAITLCKITGSAINHSLIPSADNTYDLGSASKQWRTAYLGTNLVFGAASAKIIPGATSLLVRNNADNATNLSLTDAGILGLRNSISISAAANISTTTGALRVKSGDAQVIVAPNALDTWSFPSGGAFTQDATNGASIVMTVAGTALGQPTAGGISAAGTTIADAATIDRVFNNISTVASGAGVKFAGSAWPRGTNVFVKNSGANALLLYPNTATGTINGGSAGASVSIATGAIAQCFLLTVTETWICSEAPAA